MSRKEGMQTSVQADCLFCSHARWYHRFGGVCGAESCDCEKFVEDIEDPSPWRSQKGSLSQHVYPEE